MDKLQWIGLPIVIIGFVFGSSWVTAIRDADAREKAWKEKAELLKREQSASKSEQTQREYVLEVVSVGTTVEKYRQQKLWDVLQSGTAYKTIREQDPKKYEWSGNDKGGVSGGRACDALENAIGPIPMFWGVPSFYAGGPILDPDQQPGPARPIAGLAASAVGTGLAWHLFVTAPWKLAERPDRLLEEVFKFFDRHPDVPFIVLLAEDSLDSRNSTRPRGTPSLMPDGYYIPEIPDSTSVIVLARRERVEPLRTFAWEDPDNNYLQETLRRTYFALQDSVPTLERLANPGKIVPVGRQPTVAEWLATADAFAKRKRTDASDVAPFLGYFNRWGAQPPKNWKPTPWFPVSWNSNQLAAFDNLPTLGFIHRPVFVRFEDEHGKPVTRREQRQKLLEEGWQQALQTLPEAERTKGPARIIGAFGKHPEQQIAFETLLHRYAEQGGPEIDTGKTEQFINTDHRIGNMGAATFFVQMALGVMGSYNAGGTSAAVNMRETEGASIVFISPPPDEKRKSNACPPAAAGLPFQFGESRMQSVPLLFRHVILAASLCAAPAFADNTLTAQLTDFSYTLTDLDPNDAYTPGGVDPGRGSTDGSLWLLGFDPRTEIDREVEARPGTAGSDSGQVGAYAGAWSIGANLDQSVSLTSSGYGIGWVDTAFRIPVTLQPNTAITLTGHLAMDWTQTGTELPGTASGLTSIFRVGAADQGTSEFVYGFDAPDSVDTDLSITYTHRGSAPLIVYVSSSLTAHSSIFPPVPEPSTYAMLGVGLAVVGWTARRRQSRS
ncbi:type VI lipase adapter Tla3 domain-containing protein [Pseudoduganella umbonata]|nr:DUF2875 family protein [Pseudoduganella umbonata]MBB3222780.1 hypothetical protein [Pseudoduganella umbonata]